MPSYRRGPFGSIKSSGGAAGDRRGLDNKKQETAGNLEHSVEAFEDERDEEGAVEAIATAESAHYLNSTTNMTPERFLAGGAARGRSDARIE